MYAELGILEVCLNSDYLGRNPMQPELEDYGLQDLSWQTSSFPWALEEPEDPEVRKHGSSSCDQRTSREENYF